MEKTLKRLLDFQKFSGNPLSIISARQSVSAKYLVSFA